MPLHPYLNFLSKINLHDKEIDLEDIVHEIEINLTDTIRMVKQFLTHLKKQKSAAITKRFREKIYILIK